jgi:conjugative relaxase-like TrwC/TraI family protein
VIRERQGGWDLTFSAPKSVSALFAIAPPSKRETILQSQEAAVKKTLADLEKEIGFSRRGPGGILQVPAKLAFALYLHVTSRAQDPQIHSHCVLLNVGVREDGTTGTIVSQKVFRWKMLAGALYRVNLARELRSRLGLSLRTEKTWFQIEGVPAALM